jgi:hypothetical protein
VAMVAHGSLRTLPGAVPVLEAKARSRMTPHGARGWLLRRLRHGGAAHANGGARCGLNSRAMAERVERTKWIGLHLGMRQG